MNPDRTSRRPSWRQILGTDAAAFYAMADLASARQIGAALWFGGALVAAILLPFASPVDSSLGEAGWIVAIGIIAFAFGYSARLLRWNRGVTPNELLALNYVAVGLISALMWLDGGGDAPYTELLLLPVIYTAAVHPPVRTIVFLLVVGVALVLPLVYLEDQPLSDQLARFLLWSSLAMAAVFYTATVRLNRAGLVQEGKEARSEARLDPLTGLGNRRAYNEALLAATARAGRTGSALSVIVADLDTFKQINDGYGLPAGDDVLRDVADVLSDTVRRPDACFRWGGDEFVVVADSDHSGAEQLATRLAKAISAACRRPDGRPVRVHVGVAQMGSDGNDPADLLTVASRALKPPADQPA